ncbi:MAG: hypothetical protein R3B72_50570 [Polyangiaceae bacterium]
MSPGLLAAALLLAGCSGVTVNYLPLSPNEARALWGPLASCARRQGLPTEESADAVSVGFDQSHMVYQVQEDGRVALGIVFAPGLDAQELERQRALAKAKGDELLACARGGG